MTGARVDRQVGQMKKGPLYIHIYVGSCSYIIAAGPFHLVSRGRFDQQIWPAEKEKRPNGIRALEMAARQPFSLNISRLIVGDSMCRYLNNGVRYRQPIPPD